MSVCLWETIQKIRSYVKKYIGEITWPKHAGRLKPNLKQTELQKLNENKKTENHERQRLATPKRLKRGDDNEFERNLRLEKVVSRKCSSWPETEEDRRARLENDAATTRLRLAMEMDEECKAKLENMVATHSSC